MVSFTNLKGSKVAIRSGLVTEPAAAGAGRGHVTDMVKLKSNLTKRHDMQYRLSPNLAAVLGLLALGVITWTGDWFGRNEPISVEDNLDATLDISKLEHEAQQALPSSGLSQIISSKGSVLRTQALSDMSGSNLAEESTDDDSMDSDEPKATDKNSNVMSGTLQGTGMTVDLQPVDDDSVDSLKGTVSQARSERQKLQSRINKLEAATQMLSSPTNRGEGASYSSDTEVTVGGGGFITNVAPAATLADCTGAGCVQRLPGIPAVPGRLAAPGHTITDIDATLPGRVARATVAQFLPQVQPLLAQIAAEDNARFEYEGGELRALSAASRQNVRKVTDCPRGRRRRPLLDASLPHVTRHIPLRITSPLDARHPRARVRGAGSRGPEARARARSHYTRLCGRFRGPIRGELARGRARSHYTRL